MRISDWSSDVCSSDLVVMERQLFPLLGLHDSYIDVPKEKMGNYAQGYDKANLPVRVNPGVLANEAYGVKTTAKDLIHYVKLSINSSQGEGALDKILRDTRVGYFKLGDMTQDLIWEQYEIGRASCRERVWQDV